MPEIRLFVVMEREDDPRKCTAAKLVRLGDAREVVRVGRIPRGAIVLNPEAEKALSREDLQSAGKLGILALDCSWNRLSKFPKVRDGLRHRGLPFLLAANPTNFGKAQKLSTAEALAAALYILGEKEHATRLMRRFRWGGTFLSINRDQLEAYAAARTSKEVVDAQKRILMVMEKNKDGRTE